VCPIISAQCKGVPPFVSLLDARSGLWLSTAITYAKSPSRAASWISPQSTWLPQPSAKIRMRTRRGFWRFNCLLKQKRTFVSFWNSAELHVVKVGEAVRRQTGLRTTFPSYRCLKHCFSMRKWSMGRGVGLVPMCWLRKLQPIVWILHINPRAKKLRPLAFPDRGQTGISNGKS